MALTWYFQIKSQFVGKTHFSFLLYNEVISVDESSSLSRRNSSYIFGRNINVAKPSKPSMLRNHRHHLGCETIETINVARPSKPSMLRNHRNQQCCETLKTSNVAKPSKPSGLRNHRNHQGCETIKTIDVAKPSKPSRLRNHRKHPPTWALEAGGNWLAGIGGTGGCGDRYRFLKSWVRTL